MKKIYIIVSCLILLIITGCELNNNPTSKVEELLGKYQGLDKTLNYNYTQLINETNLTKEEKKELEDLIKKQYRNMTYEIKEEKIDGETAIVTTEIEVIDYKKTLSTNKNYTDMIKKMKETKDKITYTTDFTITRAKNGKWEIEPLTEEQKLKLLGIY